MAISEADPGELAMTLRRCAIAAIAVVALTMPLPARADHDPPEYSDRQIQDLIDFAFERDLETARASSMEEVLKQKAIERLTARHNEQREPYVRQLTTLHSRILSLVA